MERLRSPRGKLLMALGLLLLLSLGVAGQGASGAALARWGLLGCAAVAGLWAWRRQGTAGRGRFALPERLRVHARAGLSPRCGLALVEADGERFLVAYGEGFATIRRAAPARRRRRRGLRAVPGLPVTREGGLR